MKETELTSVERAREPSALLVSSELDIGYGSLGSSEFTLACSGLTLDVKKGEFAAIVGRSGCGKTTFLEAVAGLVRVTAGTLTLNGKPVRGAGPDRALVFQRPSLFPWYSVRDNVIFGLRARRDLRPDSQKYAEEMIRIVGLQHVWKRKPFELSGGMQQRVNLARALACDPSLLLLDEPFASVDAQTRRSLQDELLNIWQSGELGGEKTAVLVTHDIAEAVYLADRVLVFSDQPAHLSTVVPVTIPRPRSREWQRASDFGNLCDLVDRALRGSVGVQSNPLGDES